MSDPVAPALSRGDAGPPFRETRPPAGSSGSRRSDEARAALERRIDALGDLLALRVRARGAGRATAARRRLLAAAPRFDLLRELLFAEGGADDAIALLDAVRARDGAELPRPLLDGRELLDLGVPPRKPVGHWMKRLTLLGLGGKLRTKEEAAAFIRKRMKT